MIWNLLTRCVQLSAEFHSLLAEKLLITLPSVTQVRHSFPFPHAPYACTAIPVAYGSLCPVFARSAACVLAHSLSLRKFWLLGGVVLAAALVTAHQTFVSLKMSCSSKVWAGTDLPMLTWRSFFSDLLTADCGFAHPALSAHSPDTHCTLT